MGELTHGHDVADNLPAIRQRGDGDEGVVPDFVAPRHERGAISDVAMRILKFVRRQPDAKGKPLLHDEHLTFEPGLEHKQHRGRHGSFVGEVAADTNGEIQGGPVHIKVSNNIGTGRARRSVRAVGCLARAARTE